MKIQNSQYLSALQIPNQFPVQSSNTRKTVLQPEGGSFQDILAGKTGRTEGELKFSNMLQTGLQTETSGLQTSRWVV